MKKIITLLLFYLFISNVHAGQWTSITGFDVWTSFPDSEAMRVATSAAKVNPDVCQDPDSYAVSTALSELLQARIFSTLMSAKIHGRSVELYISGCEHDKPAITVAIMK